MSHPVDWQQAYARQAQADLAAWKELQIRDDVRLCHQLQFLQMCCEKLVKAHLCSAGADPTALQSSHAYIAKNLPVIARQQLNQLTKGALARNDYRLVAIKHLSREIELLSPAVDDGGRRPDNCEYPWEQDRVIQTPADHSFPNLKMLTDPMGRTLLKLIERAITDLL